MTFLPPAQSGVRSGRDRSPGREPVTVWRARHLSGLRNAGRPKALPDSQAQVAAAASAQGQLTAQCKSVHDLSADTHTTKGNCRASRTRLSWPRPATATDVQSDDLHRDGQVGPPASTSPRAMMAPMRAIVSSCLSPTFFSSVLRNEATCRQQAPAQEILPRCWHQGTNS